MNKNKKMNGILEELSKLDKEADRIEMTYQKRTKWNFIVFLSCIILTILNLILATILSSFKSCLIGVALIVTLQIILLNNSIVNKIAKW